MSIAVTVPAVQDIMNTEEERSFWEVVRHHERPPFYDVAEGVNNRLNRAARLVYEEKIAPNSDGSYRVEGTNGHVYRVREHCSCPDSTHRQRPCYHFIAVCLYVEWQRRLNHMPGQEALPLPPASVDARLAQAPLTPQEALGDPMTEDPSPYIPEPDDAPVAVLEAPRATRALTPVASPASDLEQAMVTWSAQRQVVKRFLQHELTANVDYYQLQLKGRTTKPVLSKAGSEKFLGLMQLHAVFTQDDATWTMLGKPEGTLCYICHLQTRSGELVGEGRGARSIKQDGGDINKTVKMAQKSAQIDAVLRSGALSDVFTQDLTDDEAPPTEPQPPARPSSAALRSRIWAIVQARAPQATSREAVVAWVQETTGYDLVPDHYADILAGLEAGGWA